MGKCPLLAHRGRPGPESTPPGRTVQIDLYDFFGFVKIRITTGPKRLKLKRSTTMSNTEMQKKRAMNLRMVFLVIVS
ncbi:TPA: hypothetical protein MHW54_24375 [Klebsiella pneumoniae]|nr:hypothetical protein [Klebsiella pneumoniae]HBX3289192.1 hypothetical protein [Klebsiella pneumoniae]